MFNKLTDICEKCNINGFYAFSFLYLSLYQYITNGI